MEYKRYKLNDIVSVLKKTINPQKYLQDDFIVYSLPAFDNSKTPEILKGNRINSNKIVLDNKCILFNKLNLKFKRVWIYNNTFTNAICSTEYIPLVCNNKIVDLSFLYYYIISDFFYSKLLGNVSGTSNSHQRIHKEDLLEKEISLPNIIIQQKIVKILKNIDKKIELNNQINDNLQNLINNLFIKFFVNFDTYKGNYKESDLGMIPENFDVDTLGNVISFSNGYGWNSKDMLDNYINNSYKIFKMGNINIGGGINKAKTKSWIEKDKVENLEQYISKKGDILMCMTDMKNSGNPLLGHTALIDRDDEFVINQRVGILRCDKTIGYSYIYTMSNMPDFINDIRSRANSGVQVNLTTKGICDTLILVPDNNTLSEFENVAIPLYEQIFINNNENESLEQLRDTLLPKLMNGEIDLDKIEI